MESVTICLKKLHKVLNRVVSNDKIDLFVSDKLETIREAAFLA